MVCLDVAWGRRAVSTSPARSMLAWTVPVAVAYEPQTIPSDAPITVSLYTAGFSSVFGIRRRKKKLTGVSGREDSFFRFLFGIIA